VLPRGQRDAQQRLDEFVKVERRVDVALVRVRASARASRARVSVLGLRFGWGL